MRSLNSSVTTLVLNFTSWVSISSTSTSSILLTNPTTSTASVRRLLLVRSTRLLSMLQTLSVTVQSVRQTQTESVRFRLLRMLPNPKRDRRLLKSTDVFSFNSKKQLVSKERTFHALKSHPTKPISRRKRPPQCSELKLLEELLKWKFKRHNTTSNKSVYVLRKSFEKRFLRHRLRLLQKQKQSVNAASLKVRQMLCLLVTMLKLKVPRRFLRQRRTVTSNSLRVLVAMSKPLLRS